MATTRQRVATFDELYEAIKALPEGITGETQAGVRHVWLVDPDARFVEVYEPRDGVPAQVAVAREADAVVLPPFDLEIDLATLWLLRR